MPALSAAAKHDSRVASTWIAFSHARSTGAKLLLHYGVIKTGRSDKRRLRNMLRHSGGEIGASQSTVLINIRHDVSSQNIYNLNKTLRSDTYIFFFLLPMIPMVNLHSISSQFNLNSLCSRSMRECIMGNFFINLFYNRLAHYQYSIECELLFNTRTSMILFSWYFKL